MDDESFPRLDDAFNGFQEQLIAAIEANPDAYGVSAADVETLKVAQADWHVKYPARLQAELDALAATAACDQARALLETRILALTKHARAHDGITEGLLVAAALSLRDAVGPPLSTLQPAAFFLEQSEQSELPEPGIRQARQQPESPRVDSQGNFQWENWHATIGVGGDVTRLYTPWNKWNPDEEPSSPKFAPGLAGLCAIVKQAETDGKRLRGVGAKWSLNSVAFVKDYLVNTTVLNQSMMGFSPRMVAPAFHPVKDSLVFAQCGMHIKDLNDRLQEKGLALPTMGASNGQTLAGAVSTGTHGSMHAVGAMQDFVLGLHIVGEGGKHYWIQRQSRPVMTRSFADWLKAELIEDDEMFLAAVVSFGSFGLVHAIMFNAVPLYLLAVCNTQLDYDDVRNAVIKMDPSLLPLAHHPPGPLVHFECVINPYLRGRSEKGAFVRVYYEQSWVPGDPKPQLPLRLPDGQVLRCGDLVSIIGALANAFPWMIPEVLQGQLAGSVPPTDGQTILGMPGQQFGDSSRTGHGTSFELGVPLDHLPDALDAIFAMTARHTFGAPVALRYVRSSEALLAFTHFSPTTCTIEMPGISSSQSEQGHKLIWNELRRRKIPHSFHWGQQMPMDPDWVRDSFGVGGTSSRLNRWLAARRTFLPTERGRRMFSNDLLDALQLSR